MTMGLFEGGACCMVCVRSFCWRGLGLFAFVYSCEIGVAIQWFAFPHNELHDCCLLRVTSLTLCVAVSAAVSDRRLLRQV